MKLVLYFIVVFPDHRCPCKTTIGSIALVALAPPRVQSYLLWYAYFASVSFSLLIESLVQVPQIPTSNLQAARVLGYLNLPATSRSKGNFGSFSFLLRPSLSCSQSLIIVAVPHIKGENRINRGAPKVTKVMYTFPPFWVCPSLFAFFPSHLHRDCRSTILTYNSL